MEYKKQFEGTNVYVDKLKAFFIANNENKHILAKFIPTLFNYDVDIKTTKSKPTRVNVKRKTK